MEENRTATIGENRKGKELSSSLAVIYRDWESKSLAITKSFLERASQRGKTIRSTHKDLWSLAISTAYV